jgi:hypothetical protein
MITNKTFFVSRAEKLVLFQRSRHRFHGFLMKDTHLCVGPNTRKKNNKGSQQFGIIIPSVPYTLNKRHVVHEVPGFNGIQVKTVAAITARC